MCVRRAADLFASQHPRPPPGALSLCNVDWAQFNDKVDLKGRRIAAVVAEPWFRGVGQSWGPSAVVQLQAMCASLAATSSSDNPPRYLPFGAVVVACAVECGALAAGQCQLGSVCDFDLSAFNELRHSTYYESIVGVPMFAHPHTRLSEAQNVQEFRIDPREDDSAADGSVRVVELPVVQTGTCHGIMLWVETALNQAAMSGTTAEGSATPIFESGSPNPSRPWQRQGLRLLEEPRQLVAGDGINVLVRRCKGGTALEIDLI